jgi:glycine/D-amino acid oxidase-like deaminating enzyme
VYSTNAYTSQIVPDLKELIKPVRGTTIVTDELSSSIIPPYPLTLESGRESIRSHANRILHTSLKQQTKNKPKAHTALLDRQVSAAAFDKLKLELFKKMDKNQIGLDHTWSSVCSETPDGIPFIGEYRTNQFVLAGFNGYGFSHIYGGVNIIKDLIIKGSTQVPGSKLFNLQRLGA